MAKNIGQSKTKVGKLPIFQKRRTATEKLLAEAELAALAKRCRIESGLNKVEAAAALGVTPPTVHLAEEQPEQSLTKLRCRMIEKFSRFEIVGPLFRLKRK